MGVAEQIYKRFTRLVRDNGKEVAYANPLPVDLAGLISGEDQVNNRLRSENKPADADSLLETLQNAATATGNGTSINLKGYNGCTVVASGTFTATITFEGTLDDTNWFVVGMARVDTGVLLTSTGSALLPVYLPTGVKLAQLRARISAYTSGTVTVVARKHPR